MRFRRRKHAAGDSTPLTKYRVKMGSQTDDNYRLITLSAASPEEAREICEAKEAELVAFELDAGSLAHICEQHSIDGNTGKAHGPNPRARGLLHAHHQQVPYRFVEIEEV